MNNGLICSTYQTLLAESKLSTISRLSQLVNWVGGSDFDGLLIFDESFKSTRYHAIKKLKDKLPNARIVNI